MTPSSIWKTAQTLWTSFCFRRESFNVQRESYWGWDLRGSKRKLQINKMKATISIDNISNSPLNSASPENAPEARSPASSSERAERPDVVLLYYLYVDLPNPDEVCQQQKELCAELFLYGRIRVTPEGLNGTLDGTQAHIAAYMQRMDKIFAPHSIDWKLALYPDTCNERFTSVRIGVKEEVVALHLDADAQRKMLEAGPGV